MKLYYSKGACSLAVRITIHEVNLPCEFEAVNLKTKRTEKDNDYWAINSKGAVPVLQLDNGEILTENIAIQVYLAEKTKATRLLPEMGNMQRYRALEWLGFLNSDLHKSFSPFFNPDFPEELREKTFRPALKKRLAFVNQQLEHHHYLMGNDYMLPDAYLFVVLRWLAVTKIDLQEFPNLVSYMERMKDRKSVQQALQEEGL